jgi:hypothetical protein
VTKQEVHICDRCLKEFMVPKSSYGEITEYKINGEAIEKFDNFELCFECRVAFIKWVDELKHE